MASGPRSCPEDSEADKPIPFHRRRGEERYPRARVTVTRPLPSRPAALVATLVALVAFAGCTGAAPSPPPTPGELASAPASPALPSPEVPVGDSGPLRLVTLGDTYTSGWPLGPQYSWPAQLVRKLEPDIMMTLAGNLAAQGQTSANVVADQLWEVEGRRPQVVTLQVGVNDIIAPDIDLDDYRANIATILDALLQIVPAPRIFAVGTPDFTLTAHGGDFGARETIRSEIREANAILAAEARARAISFIDVSPVSDRVAEDPTLVWVDGLSPSAKQYAGWVELIAPRMRTALGDPRR
jgi:lysophospholipase L1-like esterase